MLDDKLKQVLIEKKFLFRGTNSLHFQNRRTRNGSYFGFYGYYNGNTNKKYFLTCTTLDILEAMVNGLGRIKSDGLQSKAEPILIAINTLPYIDKTDKGIEWPGEYVILGTIKPNHIELIDDLDKLRLFSEGLTEQRFDVIKSMFEKEFCSSRKPY